MTPYPPQFFAGLSVARDGGLFHSVPVTRAPSSGFTQISCLWTICHPTRGFPRFMLAPPLAFEKVSLPRELYDE